MFIHPSANRIYFLVFKKTAFFEMKIEKSRISWMNNTQSVRIRKNELNRTIFMILDPYKRIVRYITLDYFGRIFLTYIFVDEK